METKKTYIAPKLYVEEYESSELLAGSPQSTDTSTNTGYDTTGPDTNVEKYEDQTPAKSSTWSSWDDED